MDTNLQAKLRESLATWWHLFSSKVALYDSMGQHAGEKGQRRENALAEVLETFLPRRFSVGSGEILSAEGGRSKQIDVIIYDAINSPVLANPKESKVVPAESVYAVIEVKPDLKTGKDMQIAVENIRSAKRLARTAVVDSHGGHRHYNGPKGNCPIYGAIFTYKDHWDVRRLGEEMLKACDGWSTSEMPDSLCAGSKSVILTACNVGGKITISQAHKLKRQDLKLLDWGAGEKTLGYFLYNLFHMIAQMDLFPPDMFAYLGHR